MTDPAKARMTDEAPPVFVCMYQLTFSDGGEPEYGLLHRGSRESCEEVAKIIPAISYSCGRPLLDARMAVFEEPK